METFKDANGNTVKLSFVRNSFVREAKHVLVICRMDEKWLLTNHSVRGLEFPGGKVELGETLEDAAKREVAEETGAILKKLQFIGEYEVSEADKNPFVKAIFLGIIDRVEVKENYFETAGPVYIDGDILELRWGERFSFIMKDEVVGRSIQRIQKLG